MFIREHEIVNINKIVNFIKIYEILLRHNIHIFVDLIDYYIGIIDGLAFNCV